MNLYCSQPNHAARGAFFNEDIGFQAAAIRIVCLLTF
jgi:hypothetical protein